MKRFLLGLVLLLAVAAGVLYFVPATLLASVRTVERGLAGLSEHSVQVDNLRSPTWKVARRRTRPCC